VFGFDRLHVGAAEDGRSLTGCTVLIFDGGARASADIRGASPGTRETALLSPEKQMDRIDAILLTGGSAFGLAAATGVMRYLSENNMGYRTPWKVVPIVPAAVVFDLNLGAADRFPDEAMGYAACMAAMKGEFQKGAHGAGTGTTVGKWAGLENAMKSGQGTGTMEFKGINVFALAVVNSVGDIVDGKGNVIAGAVKNGRFLAAGNGITERLAAAPILGTNTTLVAIVTNVKLSKVELNRVAQRGHDALARKIVPVHTSYDGDSIFAASFGEVEAPLDLVSALAVEATEAAIDDAVKSAEPLGGLPSYSTLPH
jgi:L-aminopeptidase/D-esterase-like protein